MKIKVLGCSGAEYPGYNLPAFLIDDRLLLDGGTIGTSLDETSQGEIKSILLTHSHLDHIKGIPFMADNIVVNRRRQRVTVLGIRETLDALKNNLLNNQLWPDFTGISSSIQPVIRFREIAPGTRFRVQGYTVTAQKVNHTVPAVGYVVKDRNRKTVLYTGDTGPTDRIWKLQDTFDAVIVEVSFPNSMEAMALKTGHLTAQLLLKELNKIKRPPGRVFITHPKPHYLRQIKAELGGISGRTIEMLKEGRVYEV